MTHAALVLGVHFKHNHFAKKDKMLEIIQGKFERLISHNFFVYNFKKTMQRYIWNAITDAVQEALLRDSSKYQR